MLTSSHRTKTAARKALALFSGILLSLLVVEALSRIFLPIPQQVTIEAIADPGAKAGTPQTEFNWPQDPVVGTMYVETLHGRRLRANTHVTIHNHPTSHQTVEIRTNSIGYRNREIGPKSGTRILFLGDSITFGDFIAENETFVRLLEKTAANHGRKWETINAAVGAISLENELSILVETGLKLQPDVVVLDFYLNDFRESPGIIIHPVPSWITKSRFVWNLYSLYQKFSVVKGTGSSNASVIDLAVVKKQFLARNRIEKGDWRKDPAAFNGQLVREFDDVGAAWSPEVWNYLTPLLWELKRLSLKHHFQVIIVFFPIWPQVEADYVYDYPQKKMKELARQMNIPVLDMLPVFRKAFRESSELIFYDKCHHTPFGHQIIAKELYEFISPRLNP